jgi:hypothetical protein
MEKMNFSYGKVKEFDEELEKFEKLLRKYLAENDIERGNEIDQELFDVYDKVRDLRSYTSIAINQYDEKEELDEGLKERLRRKLKNLGLIDKAGQILIAQLLAKLFELIFK